MAQIDMNRYMLTPATVFDLQGRCWLSERSEGVPCRIKVGPRRWLNEYVIPEALGVTVWLEQKDQTTYLQKEPVQASVDENGVLTVDMVAFAQEYFGKHRCRFCDSETWKWYKNEPFSDTFLTTDCGIAASRSVWLDIDVVHSDLYLMPGTLNLCGHDVRHIYWETFCEELGSSGTSMRPLVEEILGGSHTVSAKEALKRLKQIKDLKDWGFNHLQVSTDHGVFRIGVGLNHYLTVDLAGAGLVMNGYEPNRKNSILTDLEILLQLLQASSGDEVRAAVEDLCRRGLLEKRTAK